MKLPIRIDDRFIRDANDVIVVIVGVTAADEADFIVHAVNSHADLVTALEAAEEYISVDTDIPAADAVLVQIRIALAEAKGGSQS